MTFAIDARVKWLERNRPSLLASFKQSFGDLAALEAAVASADRQRADYGARIASLRSKSGWADWDWNFPKNRTPPSWSFGLLKRMVSLASATDRRNDALKVVSAEVTRRLRKRSVGSRKTPWVMATDVDKALKIVNPPSSPLPSPSIEQGRGMPGPVPEKSSSLFVSALEDQPMEDQPSPVASSPPAPSIAGDFLQEEEPQGLGSFFDQPQQAVDPSFAGFSPQGSVSLQSSRAFGQQPQGSESLSPQGSDSLIPQGSVSLNPSQGSTSLSTTSFFPPRGSAISLFKALATGDAPALEGLLDPAAAPSSPPSQFLGLDFRPREPVDYAGLAAPSRRPRRQRHQADPPSQSAAEEEEEPEPEPEPTGLSASATSTTINGLLDPLEHREMLERAALLQAPPSEHALREAEYLATMAFRREMEAFVLARAPRHYWN